MEKIKTSATPISWVYAAVIIYASLFPFVGWRNQAIYPWEFLFAPFPNYWTGYDLLINLLGYIPFGFFLTLADLRVNKKTRKSIGNNWVFAIVLSLILEAIQTYLPSRVPSTIDFLLNSLGACIGACIAYYFEKHRIIDAWNQFRYRWLIKDSVGPFACLMIWPLAIVYPPTIPFLMGNIIWGIKSKLSQIFIESALGEMFNLNNQIQGQITFWESLACVATGLLVPIFLGYCIVPMQRHRMWLILIVASVGASALMISSTLTFGIMHVFSWVSLIVCIGYFLATAFALAFIKASTKSTQFFVLALIIVHLIFTNGISTDVYLAQSIQIWDQARNARFIGLTQWVGWTWPYIVFMLVLLRLLDKKLNKTYTNENTNKKQMI